MLETDLKDFPVPIPGYEEYDRLQEWIQKVTDWRNSFEKALRQELTDVGRDEQLPQDIERDLTLMLKEILGE